MPGQVFDGVIALAVLPIYWSVKHPCAEVQCTRIVRFDIFHAHANEVGDASRIGRKLLATNVCDDDGTIGADG